MPATATKPAPRQNGSTATKRKAPARKTAAAKAAPQEPGKSTWFGTADHTFRERSRPERYEQVDPFDPDAESYPTPDTEEEELTWYLPPKETLDAMVVMVFNGSYGETDYPRDTQKKKAAQEDPTKKYTPPFVAGVLAANDAGQVLWRPNALIWWEVLKQAIRNALKDGQYAFGGRFVKDYDYEGSPNPPYVLEPFTPDEAAWVDAFLEREDSEIATAVRKAIEEAPDKPAERVDYRHKRDLPMDDEFSNNGQADVSADILSDTESVVDGYSLADFGIETDDTPTNVTWRSSDAELLEHAVSAKLPTSAPAALQKLMNGRNVTPQATGEALVAAMRTAGITGKPKDMSAADAVRVYLIADEELPPF